MGSASTRLEIVTDALALSGRDVSIKTLCNQMLNRMLRDWALRWKFAALRKTGSAITLSSGSSTASLPSDFGAGMDSLLFGDSRVPLYERSADDFVYNGGYPGTSAGSGMPSFYMVDEASSYFRFNCPADRAYSFIPIYYYIPAAIDTSSSGDSTTVWIKNDELAVQGLVHKIYQYMGDDREGNQEAVVERMMAAYRRGTTPVGGGVPKIQLSRTAFPRRRY